MSISIDDIIQINTGSFNSTTGNATLPSGTTDGNLVVVVVMSTNNANLSITGFTRPHGSTIGSTRPYMLHKPAVTAGETSWAINGVAPSQPVVWVAMEIQGASELNPTEGWANPNVSALSGTSIASATTTQSYSYETLVLAVHGGQNTASGTIPSFTGHTGDFNEIASSGRTDTTTGTAISVSAHIGADIGTYQTTATASVSLASANATVVIYNTAGGRRVPNIDVMSGAETGTAAGRATGNTSNPPVDATAGTVAVVTTSPRTGSYCWELSGTSAAANFAWTSTGAMSLYSAPTGYTAHRQYVGRFSFYFPGSLPGADVTVAAVDNGTGLSGAGFQLVYRTASQKIGVQVTESATFQGSEVLSAVTVAADTWHDIDFYLDMTNRRREQLYHVYWRLNGVDQTDAVCATDTATAVSTFTQMRFGWTTATTATIRYDDIVCSKHPGHYPLGPIGVYGLSVDPAGTVTVTTAANFSTFTSNGTINSTFNVTTARGAVDDLPPVIGGTADGFVQDTAGATDYVAVPMTTRAGATNLQAVRGVRWYFCGWAASTTASSIGFRGYDGATETLLFTAADPNFDNSTTAPAWVCRMHRDLASAVPFFWSQAQLDALTARVGFSGSVPVVVGVHSIIAEVAMRAGVEIQVLEDNGALIYATLDPDTSNVIAYRLVAPGDGDAWATYTISGVDQNRTATVGTEDLYVVGAEANSVVTNVTGGRS